MGWYNIDLAGTGGGIAELIFKTVMMEHSLDTNINELDITMRSFNALRRAKISMIGELTKMTREELLALPGFGKGSLADVETALMNVGFPLLG